MSKEKLMATAIVIETMASEVQRIAMQARVAIEYSDGREEKLVEASAKLAVAKSIVSAMLRSFGG